MTYDALDEGVSGSTVESQWLGLKRTIMSSVKKHIPTRSISCRKRLPWISNSVMNLMRQRDRAYKAAKRRDSPGLWDRYRSLRNKVVGALREAKRDFLCSLSGKVRDSTQLWAAYRSISSSSSRVPTTLADGNTYATSTLAHANLLNNRFSSFFTPASSAQAPCFCPAPGIPSLSRIECGSEVMAVLASLRAKKACGPDGITATILKKCVPSIADALAEVFNLPCRGQASIGVEGVPHCPCL